MKYSIDEIINIIQDNPPFREMLYGIHGRKHANNVLFFANMLATIIQEKGGDEIDFKSLTIAALLHDCGRVSDSDDPKHAKESAILAQRFIEDKKIDCNAELVAKIIKSHCPPKGFSLKNLPIECKILGDADKLDRFRFHNHKAPLKVELLELKESFSLINFAARVNDHEFRTWK